LISAELYNSDRRPIVLLERDVYANVGAWARLQEAYARGVVGGSENRTEVRADVFLAELEALRAVRGMFGESIVLGSNLQAQLRALAADRRQREHALTNRAPFDLPALEAELRAAGFRRQLKAFQLKNLAVLLRLPHGADFSVPGAGKTSVALASFAIGRARGVFRRSLVVAPIAAFSAWKDDAVDCFTFPPNVAVHMGPDSLIPQTADILLTNYNRVAADYDRLRAFVAQQSTQIVLDEAHRVKRGALGVHGRAVLDLAYSARRRDILTGTPAPQGAYDLIALVRFLYPGQDNQILPRSVYTERDGRDAHVLRDTSAAIERYFVRTPKSELALPPTTFEVVRREMGPIQRAIYSALVGRYCSSFQLEKAGRREFDRLGRIVMYLLEAATNPILLVAGSDEADDLGFRHPPIELSGDEPLTALLSSYHQYETPWKYTEVSQIVQKAATRGEKVLIWSTFIRNLKALGRYLAEFKPAIIHGGIPPEDGAPAGVVTREQELWRFRHDASCSVLLANPAACGEGVSLHHCCHHAVYLDRSFNAGHFLQSQDRIHRLGLTAGTLTRFTILASAGSIDDAVDERLRHKIIALSHLMNDSGLVQVSLPESDEGQASPPVQPDDIQEVVAHIKRVSPHAA
jgi:SNF2 family DNA or RNA helicase